MDFVSLGVFCAVLCMGLRADDLGAYFGDREPKSFQLTSLQWAHNRDKVPMLASGFLVLEMEKPFLLTPLSSLLNLRQVLTATCQLLGVGNPPLKKPNQTCSFM
jgi:hypothetical protein